MVDSTRALTASRYRAITVLGEAGQTLACEHLLRRVWALDADVGVHPVPPP